MPHLCVISASGTAQRRLISDVTARLESKGYALSGKQDGGGWGSLISDNSGAGLFSLRRYYIVEEAEKLGPLSENLSGLLEPDDADVWVIAVFKGAPGSVVPASVLKKCTHEKVTESSNWPSDRERIAEDIASSAGISIAREARSLIGEWFEDQEELRAEVGKLVDYVSSRGRREVTSDDLWNLSLDDGSGAMLKLLNGLCARNVTDCLSGVAISRARGDLLPLATAIYNRMRLAWYAAKYPLERQMMMRALGAKPYAWRQAESGARNFSERALKKFVLSLIELSANEKSGRGGGWCDLEMAMMELLALKKNPS